ncbi:N-acetylmuramoyl-L-alanine amidase [Lentibacillus sp. N15]|uniref:N-acetylmuramoyl-L-alanine amidase n=1 Tax=Lentibacillus songyuanensis TaxID=3136161 RepID=UPI0031BB3CED
MKKICLFTLGIGMVWLLFSYASVSYAEGGQTYEVGGSSVNVRATPSHDADVIGQLDNGDQIVVFQESFGWLQTYYDGQEAWVASQFVTQAEDNDQSQATETSTETVTVTSDDVRVRTGPGTEYDIIGYTTTGDSYTLLETGNSWFKVALDNGEIGWIASWLTDNASEQQATTKNEQEVAAKATTNGSLSGYTVVLDPGHGGKDPGSIALDGSFEKEYTLSTAAKVAQKLQNAGARVIQTRTNDVFIPLQDRVNKSEANNADAFISLHFNAYPENAVNGFSTYYYAGDDHTLAQDVQTGLSRHIVLNSRGVMKSDYHVLRENSNPAILLELGFITNTTDLANIQTDSFQNAVADGVTDGLLDYFQ